MGGAVSEAGRCGEIPWHACCSLEKEEEIQQCIGVGKWTHGTRAHGRRASSQPHPLVGKAWDTLDGKCVKALLPDELSESTVAKIRDTLPAINSKLAEIIESFHLQIPDTRPELMNFFRAPTYRKRDFRSIFWGLSDEETKRTVEALGFALQTFVENLNHLDKVDRQVQEMAIRHCALDVQPHHYLLIADDMADVMEVALGRGGSSEVRSAWHSAMLHLAKALIEHQEVLYRDALHRKGGWQGLREFVIVGRKSETMRLTVFDLRPLDANCTGVEFTPGQFVSVRIPLTPAPSFVNDGRPARSYTVISKPGEQTLRIAIKRNFSDGTATWFHTHGRVGCNVLLTPPFGGFVPRGGDKATAILISAGLGVVQTWALFQALREQVCLFVHVDKTPEVHAFAPAIVELACECGTRLEAHYTEHRGRPPIKEYVSYWMCHVGSDHHWYISGPSSFMQEVRVALRSEADVPPERIHQETYGPEVGLGWPLQLPT